ncbi:homoserine kinase [Rubrivirga sp. IMCC45206]|uniref:homoserine kinase n=1 Tax=Rubrivirga sp. IMCC45206 TaxID=3391614 RepID=UPI00399031C6
MSTFTAFGPATLSNLGPGFDALGLCITGLGDRVTATRTDAPGVTVDAPGLPSDPEKNTAGRAALHVLRKAGAGGGMALSIEKGIPLGSGVGGSSASAVAGAWAANLALGRPFEKADLVGAVLAGEAAAGAAHGDNVLPALFGGLVVVSPSDPTDYRRIDLPAAPPLAVVLPDVTVLTRDARAALPATVAHGDASAQAAELAFLLRAVLAGDWAEAGRRMMRDRLAEPFRAPLVPVYDAVKQAALDAGAAGCALSGSGPAMVAVCPDGDAPAVLTAMTTASRHAGVGAHGWLATVDPVGVREGLR